MNSPKCRGMVFRSWVTVTLPSAAAAARTAVSSEVPGVFSQGDALAELEENIRDVYELVLADAAPAPRPTVAPFMV